MKVQGLTGTVMLAVGGMCPLVHVPIMGNWNYFGIDPLLGIIFYGIVVLSLIASLSGKTGLIRFCGWAAVLWVILTLAAVWFKSHDYFSFIHFKKLINLASGMVKYKWGWFVIITGALLLMITRKTAAKPVIVSEV